MTEQATLADRLCGVVALKTVDSGGEMNNWKYAKNNVTEVEIKEVESLSGFLLSDELKKVLIELNNGRPKNNLFDTKKAKGRVFEKLLSINKEDSENIFKTNESLSNQLPENMLALAADPFGNYICINKDQQAFLWLHETSELEATGKTMTGLIDSLYS